MALVDVFFSWHVNILDDKGRDFKVAWPDGKASAFTQNLRYIFKVFSNCQLVISYHGGNQPMHLTMNLFSLYIVLQLHFHIIHIIAGLSDKSDIFIYPLNKHSIQTFINI